MIAKRALQSLPTWRPLGSIPHSGSIFDQLVRVTRIDGLITSNMVIKKCLSTMGDNIIFLHATIGDFREKEGGGGNGGSKRSP